MHLLRQRAFVIMRFPADGPALPPACAG
jgi:hypothetical protein